VHDGKGKRGSQRLFAVSQKAKGWLSGEGRSTAVTIKLFSRLGEKRGREEKGEVPYCNMIGEGETVKGSLAVFL